MPRKHNSKRRLRDKYPYLFDTGVVDRIHTLPQQLTVQAPRLAALAVAGSPTIEVEDYQQFPMGSWITIGVGPTKEARVVVGYGSLVLDRPLDFNHLPGEPVALVDSRAVAATTRIAAAYRGSRSRKQAAKAAAADRIRAAYKRSRSRRLREARKAGRAAARIQQQQEAIRLQEENKRREMESAKIVTRALRSFKQKQEQQRAVQQQQQQQQQRTKRKQQRRKSRQVTQFGSSISMGP